MLPDRYFIAGLDALCRSYSTSFQSHTHEKPDAFRDSHRGAGMLASCYLFQDCLVDDTATGAVQAMLDHEWLAKPLFSAMDSTLASEREFQDLVTLFAKCLRWDSGRPHDFIFPSLALRALAERPELRTRERLAGLADMARGMFAEISAERTEPPIPLAAFAPDGFPDEVLNRYRNALLGYPHYAHSYCGHLLTAALALLHLQEFGHADLATIGASAFRSYAWMCTSPDADPWSWGQVRRPPPAVPLLPNQASYWQQRPAGNLEGTFGHLPKYAHAFLALCSRAKDRALVKELRNEYYLLVY